MPATRLLRNVLFFLSHSHYDYPAFKRFKSMSEEISYRIIKILEENPEISQRELAQEMGVSLGKANYCLKGLIEKGIVKANNFKNSNNKLAYAYLLTPKGIEEKSRITARYLKRRLKEYEELKKEIETLKEEVKG